jgi:hypothetical protein
LLMRASRRATDGAGIEVRVRVLGILKLYGTLPYNERFFLSPYLFILQVVYQ